MRLSLASVLVCALAAAGAAAEDAATGTAAGYESRAGAVLGTYRPAPPERLPESMARVAGRFLDSLDGDAYSLSPSFIGTYPQTFIVAGAKLRPLGAETDLAHELVASLTPEQRAIAVIGEKRGALRIGAGRDGIVPEPLGIPGRLLTGAQKDRLLALASLWFDLMPPDHARAREERFLDRLGETRFAWSGPLAAGSDVSWSIQGPSVIIEYANDARGGADAGNPVDHVHTVYRDPDRDYGGGIGDRSRP